MRLLYRLPWQKGLVRLQQKLLTAIYPPICLLCGTPGRLIEGRAVDLCQQCHDELNTNSHHCSQCGIPLPQTVDLCGECQKKSPPFESLYAPYLYQGGIRELLVALKFNQKLSHARLLGCLMLDKLAGHLEDSEMPDAIVAVPLHPKRERERGYNQALELLRPLAKRYKIPIERQLVTRNLATSKQSNLSRDERRRNLKGAFSIKPGETVPRHIVIVDDVVTTTATVTELAKTLKLAGAERIDVWAVARVPKPGD